MLKATITKSNLKVITILDSLVHSTVIPSFLLMRNPNFDLVIIAHRDHDLRVRWTESHTVDHIIMLVPGQQTFQVPVPDIGKLVLGARAHHGVRSVQVNIECSHGVRVSSLPSVLVVQKP